MGDWRKELKEAVASPAELTAQQKAEEAEYHRMAKLAVGRALLEIRQTLIEAQTLLKSRGRGVQQTGSATTLDLDKGSLTAKASADNEEISIEMPGEDPYRIVYDPRSGGLVLFGDSQVLDLDNFVGRLATRLAKS